MTNFLVLYRGNTITDAKMVAVSIDPEVIAYVADCLIDKEPGEADPALVALDHGRERALRIVRTEAAHANNP